MFGFSNKKVDLVNILDGFCDIHCHLLPGVDDGSRDTAHSLRMLQALETLGVKALYMTPHIISGAYNNRDESVMREEFANFRQEYTGNIELKLAAEYFMDDRFLGRLADNPLSMRDRHILAEFSMTSYSLHAADILFDAAVSGYNIIIAHPERYAFIQSGNDPKALDIIKSDQYKLQLNLLSLCGYHGKAAQKVAEKFLREGLYTFVGTDTHSSVYIDSLQESRVSKDIYEAVQKLKENNEKYLF